MSISSFLLYIKRLDPPPPPLSFPQLCYLCATARIFLPPFDVHKYTTYISANNNREIFTSIALTATLLLPRHVSRRRDAHEDAHCTVTSHFFRCTHHYQDRKAATCSVGVTRGFHLAKCIRARVVVPDAVRDSAFTHEICQRLSLSRATRSLQ